MNKWHYDSIKKVHTYADLEQGFVWMIGIKKKKYVLLRSWQVKSLSGTIDYIGTFKKLDVAKQAADLIRTG